MKILALAPWRLFPVMSGGQERCYNLLRQLDDVTVFSLDWAGHSEQRTVDNIHYKLIPADGLAIDQARKLKAAGVKTHDAMPMLTRNNLDIIRREIDSSDPDLIILEHPWMLHLTDGRPYVYDSHNFETDNYAQQFGTNTVDFPAIKDLERQAILNAEHMFYTSQQDYKLMTRLYPNTTPATHIPNGVTLPDTTATGNSNNLIFIGSLYGPNIQAAQELINLAPQLPQYNIQIIGGCTSHLTTTQPNVQLIGPVTDAQLHEYMLNAHMFINLTRQGSGTHLKVGRALAYGLPVISTPLGGRGYTTPIHTTPSNAPQLITTISNEWRYYSQQSRAEAETLTWDAIGETYKQVLNGLQ